MTDKIEKRQASVEVTPEMIDAGVKEMGAQCGFIEDVWDVGDVVTQVYRAMALARVQHTHHTKSSKRGL